MKVIAVRQIYGIYGKRLVGEEFDVQPELGKKLLKAKLVREPQPFTYEVQAIQPSHTEPVIEAPEHKIQNKRK